MRAFVVAAFLLPIAAKDPTLWYAICACNFTRSARETGGALAGSAWVART